MNTDPNIEIEKAFREKMAEYPKLNIVICGYTGCGKSSLLQKIFNKILNVSDCQPCTIGFEKHESESLGIWDSRGFEPDMEEGKFISTAKDFINEKIKHDPVHLTWYCIQGPGGRITKSDERLINGIFDKQRTIILLTKSDITKPQQKDALSKKLISDLGVNPENIISVSENGDGVKDLLNRSYLLLPEALKKTLQSQQMFDLNIKRNNAIGIISAASSAASFAAGANPIPMSDALLIMPIQFGMIASLAYNYGLSQESMKLHYGPIVARVIGVLAASSLVKLFPGLGNLITAGIAGSITAGLGYASNKYMLSCAEANINTTVYPEFNFKDEDIQGCK